MTSELQKKVIPVFYYSLNLGGILFIGSAENIGEYTDGFKLVNDRWKIFRRIKGPLPAPSIAYGSALSVSALPGREPDPPKAVVEKTENISEIAHRVLLNAYIPPSVVVGEKGDIQFISGHTGKYLELSPGHPNMNIFEMARADLRLELRGAVQNSFAENKKIIVRDLPVKMAGGKRAVTIIVEPLSRHGQPGDLALVVFEETPALAPPIHHATASVLPGREHDLVQQLEKELQNTKEQLLKTHTAMDRTIEEQHSANEELQSIIEEHQSTNEELMTSKEEMQSLNEELVTLNSEYQQKIGQLTQTSNDLKNLLDSTSIGTLFLDKNLRIKSFTPSLTDIINLIPSDSGRPITDIALNLRYSHIVKDAQDVLARLVPREQQVQSLDDKWYLMRLLPYRTIDNYIDGVVITFSDITAAKDLEMKLQAARAYAEGIVDTVREPLVVLDNKLNVVSANHAFYALFTTDPGRVVAKPLFLLDKGEWNIPQLRTILHEVISKNKNFKNYVVEHISRNRGSARMVLNARRIVSEDRKTDMVLLAFEYTEESEVGGNHDYQAHETGSPRGPARPRGKARTK